MFSLEEVERGQDCSLEVLERLSLGGGQGVVPVGSRGIGPAVMGLNYVLNGTS